MSAISDKWLDAMERRLAGLRKTIEVGDESIFHRHNIMLYSLRDQLATIDKSVSAAQDELSRVRDMQKRRLT